MATRKTSYSRSYRTLRDGSLEERFPRHFVPGYDRTVSGTGWVLAAFESSSFVLVRGMGQRTIENSPCLCAILVSPDTFRNADTLFFN
jgi:hypothetical protein